MEQQHTISREVTIEGRSLFHGRDVRLVVKPAPPDHGVVFVRTDLPEPVRIPALIDHVVVRDRRSALQVGDAVVETCEHFLAALVGLGMDNAIVEIDGNELPLGDGSAAPFYEAIAAAGLDAQPVDRTTLVVREAVTIEENGAILVALPSDDDDFHVLYDLDYGSNGHIPRQMETISLQKCDFAADIARARTFSLEHEAGMLWDHGLCRHLTPSEVLVIGPDGPIDNAYRYENEPARHKLLDLLGDFSLLGAPIRGRIIARRSGHQLNHRMVRELKRQLEWQERDAALRDAPEMDIDAIQRILPHRYPMLLVDRVVGIEGDQRAIGVKNVTINEPFFTGHYPGSPIMPGVLIVEAMGQLAGLLLSRRLEHTGKIAMLLSLDRVKLRRPVKPGDQLVLEAESLNAGQRTGHVQCRAFVGPNRVAEAQIKFILVDADQ
jgi:UDP-3-O-[3-hydroxymyristoyl] N-acetylglucosamine deacetylase/3-hydroxyacyl-[acyl-carrier-protein] dehydratase